MKLLTKAVSTLLAVGLCAGCARAGGSAGDDGMFTDRDYKTDYADCVTVTLSDGGSAADGAGVSIDGDVVTITQEGTYLITGLLTDGQLAVNADDADKIQLVLDNASISRSGGAALYIKSADKVFLTTAEGSASFLRSTGKFDQADDSAVDGAVFSRSDLTLNGRGRLTVESGTGHGIVCKDDLRITSGDYAITAAKDGVNANDSIRVADGRLSLQCGSDGFDCDHDDAGKGFVYISGGEIAMVCGDDGVHASAALTVSGGALDIIAHEGLEGVNVAVSGGDIDLITDEDGVNASGGADASIAVSGGVLRISSGGDSLDANGDLLISGGEISITGPSQGGNGMLDYDRAGSITGGVVAGTGVAGMQANFDRDSTQGSILYYLPAVQAAGTEISLAGSGGTAIVSFAAQADFQTILVSAPEIAAGGTYTLTVGSTEYSIEMTSLIYGAGMGGASPGPRGF